MCYNDKRSVVVERLINREILTLANSLFNKLIDDSDCILFDYIENLYVKFSPDGKPRKCTECGEVQVVNDMDSCSDCFDSPMHEVFQWFIVSEFLYERLQEVGEVVCQVEDVNFWGRTSYGIGLEYDYCLKKIATDIHNSGLKNADRLEV